MYFKPDHVLSIDGLSQKEALVMAFEAIKELGWRIKFVSDAGVIAYTENGAFSWNGELTIKLENGSFSVRCVSISAVVGDEHRRKNAVANYVNMFEAMRRSLNEDQIDELYDAYEKDFVPAYEDTLKPDIRPRFNFFVGGWSYFLPADNYFMTPILVCLNILIYVVMAICGVPIFEPEGKDLLPWGANTTVATLDGEWWRLLSNCFLHFGLIHLLLNMYALVYVGMLLEPFFSKAKFLSAYLLTGICASLVSIWWHDNTASAGASGAIFGLYGMFLAMLSTRHVEPSMRKGLLSAIGIFVVYNLVYGSFNKGIDNAAHIGGLLAGLLIGYLYMPALKNPQNRKFNIGVLAATMGVMLAISSIAYIKLAKSDRFVYLKEMEGFYEIEKSALAPFVEDEQNLPTDQMLRALKKGVNYWEKGINLLTKLDTLDLSKRMHERNKLLIRYCQLRIKSYELMYEDNFRNADPNNERQQQLIDAIRKTIKELSSR